MKQPYREETVAGLVADCLALRDEGVQDLPFDEVCAAHPELQEDVEQAVERAANLANIQVVGVGRDRFAKSLIGERYQVNDRIGSGAMGLVYSATDLDLGRDVAIKIVHSGFLERDQALMRFEREATALAAVSHESVVTIYDRGVTEDGMPFLVMELVDGVSCAQILDAVNSGARRESTDWLADEFGVGGLEEPSLIRQSIQWAAKLAGGLQAAHTAGVYHRDVKPSNIMIRRNGQPVLLDFGIAAQDDQATLTRTDAAVGTPAYMAPEAVFGRMKARSTQDVYGLAATLYHLITMQAPYKGTPSEVLTAITRREPTPAVRIRPGLPQDIQAILDVGLARNPGARYPSAKAMEQDLHALLAYRPVSARRTPTYVRVARRAWRSKVAMGAVLATAILGLIFGIHRWQEDTEHRNERRFNIAWQGVPANQGIVSKLNRVLADKNAEQQIAKTLDDVVAAGHDHASALAMRAGYRLDHGDAEGAAQDIAALAGAIPTKFTRALAARYRLVSTKSRAIQLDGLPEPEAPVDAYLMAHEHARAGKYGEAAGFLEHVDLAGMQHAEELRLILLTPAILRLPFDSPEQSNAAEALLVAIADLETRTGLKTATTAHLRSFAHDRQQQYERSLRAAEEALAMSPYSHTSLKNAGKVSYELAKTKQAEEFARRGRALLPDYPTFALRLSIALQDQGEFSKARDVIETSLPADRTDRNFAKCRATAISNLEITLAEELFWRAPNDANGHAHAALEAASVLPESDGHRIRMERYAKAMIKNDRSLLLAAVLHDLIERPNDPQALEDLPRLWPERLSHSETKLVLQWTDSLRDLRERQAEASSGALWLSNEVPRNQQPSLQAAQPSSSE